MRRAKAKPVRLLLVELMPENPERQRRAQAYPFLQAAAARLGHEASWRALGVRYEPTMRYELPEADLARLLEEASRLRTTAVVVNERLAGAQAAAIERAGPRLVYCPLDDNWMEQFREFVRALGLAPLKSPLDGPGFIESLEPDYRREVLNAAPWAAEPLIRLVAGTRCSYRTAVGDNPFYRGLKAPHATMSCSFCGVPAMPDLVADAPAFAARQAIAARRARARPGARTRFEVIGARVWPRLEEFVAALIRGGVSDAELAFMPRIDEILAARGAIRRCLPRLAASNLTLRLYGAGVENFSPDENARLNKGITAAQVHEAAAFILETRREHPRQFRFEDGDLGMILFTPWTTLADIRLNLEHIERCPLILGRTAIGTRLQLFAGRDAALLAEKDGLLAARGGDFYNSGCIVAADQSELPWRFARPEVAPLCELGRELTLHSLGMGRSAAVAALAAGRPGGLDAFRRGLETLEADPSIRTLPQLLAAV